MLHAAIFEFMPPMTDLLLETLTNTHERKLLVLEMATDDKPTPPGEQTAKNPISRRDFNLSIHRYLIHLPTVMQILDPNKTEIFICYS